MGVREESKQKTRELILSETEILLHRNGYIKVSSKDIASACSVSQGTIFLHFGTKNNLLITILFSNIEKFEEGLKIACKPKDSTDLFLKNFIDTVIEYEDIMSRAYKDYAYLDEDLVKIIDGLETIMKNLIFDNYRNSQFAKMSIVDTFVAIDAFTSQIKNYLLEKEIYSTRNSIIRQRRGKILKLYRMLFER